VAIELDHLILAVNDRARSVAFYTKIVGLDYDGEREPFSMLRVTPGFVIQLAPWGTKGGAHLAFAMSKQEFDDTFSRVKAAGIAYGCTASTIFADRDNYFCRLAARVD
jgi:catechol 2,3-dioxygenase-like lactoylglutathione lyase family enzyme